jgi:putative ABC transport system permease protein
MDLKHAFRFIRLHRGFASLVVLCLTLGTGLSSAIFSLINGVLLQPLPYKDPDRLVLVFETTRGADGELDEYNAAFPNFLDWRRQNRTFESLEALQSTFFNITGDREPERVSGSLVTSGFFSQLGAQPALGRAFLPEEHAPGGDQAVVLSHAFWQRRFGGDEGALGRSLVVDGKSYQVVGVLGPRFHFLQDADLWLPMVLDEANPPYTPGVRYLVVSGRLRPGASLEEAQTEMSTIADRLSQERPTNTGWSARVVALRENLVGDLRLALVLLLAAVGFVLLIACANVGNLLLARVVGQRDEMAIRLALGASRRDLIRQTLSESMALALLGGILGLIFAAAAVRMIPEISPVDIPLLREVRIDFRVLGFTLLVSFLTGLLPGLLAAGNGAGPDLQDHLKSMSKRTTEGVQGRRLLGALVVTEVAAALVLLVCAGLAMKSFDRLYRTHPGFDPANVFMAQVSLPEWKYQEPDQIRTFWRNLLPRIQSLPGVVSAGTTHALPVNDFALTSTFEVENRAPASPDESLRANFRKVSPDFFRTLKIPLVAGRAFDLRDDENGPRVAIVSQTMANHFWPGTSPLGKRVRRGPNAPWLTIVGVAGDVQDGVLGSKLGDTLYISHLQEPRSNNPTVHLLVRTSVAPASIAAAVRREVLAVDRDQPIDKVATLEEWIANSLSKRRFSAQMLTLFGALGITLAMIGIYGVLSYAVSRRNHEIGIRMALGAQTRDVIRLVLRQGMTLTALGLAIGLALAMSLTRLFASMLYQVPSTDPATFAGMTAALAAVAFLASYLPARRASRVDPLRSLKQE